MLQNKLYDACLGKTEIYFFNTDSIQQKVQCVINMYLKVLSKHA